MNKNFLMLIMMLGASLGGYAQHSDDGTAVEVEFDVDVEYNLKEPEAIDMGGSVLWASFNLWAEKPTDVGGKSISTSLHIQRYYFSSIGSHPLLPKYSLV